MLNYTLLFLLIALVAAGLGFGFVAVTAVFLAKVLFVIFVVLFLASLFLRAKSP